MQDERFEPFLKLSSVLTGFETFRLMGTGQADACFSTVLDIVGEETMGEFLDAFHTVLGNAGQDEVKMERELRKGILSNAKLGPLARHVIKLWYVGIWYELPADWRQSYAENVDDRTFVVSPSSYTEGLLWPAIGANPPGAKPFGYGMWATPPRIETTGD